MRTHFSKQEKKNQVNTTTTATKIQNIPIGFSMAFVDLKRTSYSSGGKAETKEHRGHSLLSNKPGMLSLCSVFSPAVHSGVCIPSQRCSGQQHFVSPRHIPMETHSPAETTCAIWKQAGCGLCQSTFCKSLLKHSHFFGSFAK